MLNSSARVIRDEIAAGKVSAVEVCRAFLERIEAVNPSLNAFNLVAADRALARADDLDRRRAKGESAGPLAGVPVAIKDNFCVRGMRTTASSRILDRFVPTLRRHGREADRGRRSRYRRQDQLRRVRHGVVQREFRVRPRAKSVGT